MNKLRTNSISRRLLALAFMLLSAIGAAQAQRETRSVDSFTSINLGGAARVLVKQGSPQSVVVEGTPEALAEFETVVKGSQLRLGFRRDDDRRFKIRNQGPVTVYVTAPNFTSLSVAGSGNIEADGPVSAEAMNLAIAGSGNLHVPQLTATSLKTAVAGSGDLQVSGRCPQNDIRISGSGNVKAQDLKTQTSTVRISGSGDAYVFASETADAKISGSGSVFVAGGGRMSSSVSGSGRIRKQ